MRRGGERTVLKKRKRGRRCYGAIFISSLQSPASSLLFDILETSRLLKELLPPPSNYIESLRGGRGAKGGASKEAFQRD